MPFCSKCGTPIDDDQEYCESCNQNTPEMTERSSNGSSLSPTSFVKKYLWNIIALILLIALIVVSILYFTKPTDTPTPDDSRKKVLEGQIEVLTKQLDSEREYSYKLSQDIAKSKAEYAALNTEYNALQKDLEEYEGIDEKYIDMYGDYAIAKARADQLERELKERVSYIEKLEKEYADISSELSNFKEASVTYLEEEVRLLRNPKPFETMEELTEWLYYDNTDYEYRKDSSLNRAYILHMRLLRAGYFVSFMVENQSSAIQTTIGGNYVYIKDDGIYRINADNDQVTLYWPNQSLTNYINEPDEWVYYTID